eukprot:TRINITY_DN12391_c3_g7_i2.p1 TRINITY_DN12391_c3_g7~~TRINITY_DN12391_c3_g7_i2.p1  ORF type:complete len:279 (+),score=28.48 TRINITY_DN12391_c3_g7_i2:92-928(+)
MDDDDLGEDITKKGVWRSCHLDYNHNECLKDAILTGIGFAVLLSCLVFVFSAIFAAKLRRTRCVLFGLATLEMLCFCVHYGLDSRAWLLITIQWFKIQLYTLPFAIFLAFTAKCSGYVEWPSRLIWPTQLAFALINAGALIYTAVTRDAYAQVCATPGWMILSSVGLGQAALYASVSIYVYTKVHPRLVPPGKQSCRRLFTWGYVCLVAPVAQIVHDSYLASDDNCAGQRLPTLEWLIFSIGGSILEAFIPIIAAMIVSIKEEGHRSDEKHPLLTSSS